MTYDMSGMEPEIPHTHIIREWPLTPKQKAVYDSLETPIELSKLYTIHDDLLPNSSVRRILYVLRNKGMAEKQNKKWRQCSKPQ